MFQETRTLQGHRIQVAVQTQWMPVQHLPEERVLLTVRLPLPCNDEDILAWSGSSIQNVFSNFIVGRHDTQWWQKDIDYWQDISALDSIRQHTPSQNLNGSTHGLDESEVRISAEACNRQICSAKGIGTKGANTVDYLLPAVTVEEVSWKLTPVVGAPTSITAFVGRSLQGPINQAVHVHSWIDYEKEFGGLGAESTMSFAVRDFFRNGGSHAVIVRLTKNDYLGCKLHKTGLYALDDIEVLNLLCIPPYSFHTDTEEHVWREATRYCENRCAMLIIDPPSNWTSVSHAVAGMAARKITASSNAVLYFPRIQQRNPLLDDKIDTFVPCGAIAGIISRTDEQSGVWKSPAGRSAVIQGIESLSVSLTNGDNNQLNALGANCLRTLPGIGQVIWGARTLQGMGTNNEWRYLAVRRTALHVQQSLSRSLKWTVSEPNSEALWKIIRRSIESFLHSLFRNGAFRGQSDKDAFFVRCDPATTTATDISLGRVNVIVGLAFLKPAEFSIMPLRLEAQPLKQIPVQRLL